MISFFKTLLMILPLSWSNVSAPSGPIVVRNGAGQGEFYLVYAQSRHENLIKLCQAQENCARGFENSLQDLLRVQISADLKLAFLTSAEMGDQLVIAKSNLLLQINKDLLFTQTDEGPLPWRYADAIRFFVHLRANSLKWTSEKEKAVSDRLADLADVVQERSMNSDYHNLSIVLFTAPVSALIVEDDSSMLASNTIEIPVANINCKDSTQVNVKISDVRLLSAKWMTSNPANVGSTLLGISGLIEYRCPNQSGAQQNFRSRYQARIQAQSTDGIWNLKPETLEIYQTEIQNR